MNEDKIIKISDGAYFVRSYSTRTLINPIPSITNQFITTETEENTNGEDVGGLFTTREAFESLLKKATKPQ